MANIAEKSEAKIGSIRFSDAPTAVEPLVFTRAHEDIAKLAYRLWEENGRQDAEADVYWLQAEQELRALGPQS